jgi:hypothetical protein
LSVLGLAIPLKRERPRWRWILWREVVRGDVNLLRFRSSRLGRR